METKQDNQESITLLVTKQDPKPNAPRYEFRTVGEIYAAITPENLDRFLQDFDAGFRMAIHIRAAVLGIAETMGTEPNNDLMKLDSFVWIDD